MRYKSFFRIISVTLVMTCATPLLAKTTQPLSPFIKAGTVAFARLDTEVNSIHPNDIVTATIIEGKYRGAKLIGKLVIGKNPAEKHLRFSHIHLAHTKQRNISAYGIDFDDARTAIVTEADFDELKRTSDKMAIAFLDNYTTKKKVNLGVGTDLGILFTSNVA